MAPVFERKSNDDFEVYKFDVGYDVEASIIRFRGLDVGWFFAVLEGTEDLIYSPCPVLRVNLRL